MKLLIFILCNLASICFAGVGGFVGGVDSMKEPAKYVTVEVCDAGESGTQCRKITYKVRPPNPQPQEPLCLIGEATQEVPCPPELLEKEPHLFKFLINLFLKQDSNNP